MHFAVKPNRLKRHTEYKIDNILDLYKNIIFLEKHVRLWVKHVGSYLALKNKYKLISYEDLILNKESSITAIVKIIGVKNKQYIINAIKNADPSRTKIIDSDHIRKGQIGNWKNYWSEKHLNIYDKSAYSIKFNND
jgi:hypothetical protein